MKRNNGPVLKCFCNSLSLLFQDGEFSADSWLEYLLDVSISIFIVQTLVIVCWWGFSGLEDLTFGETGSDLQVVSNSLGPFVNVATLKGCLQSLDCLSLSSMQCRKNCLV